LSGDYHGDDDHEHQSAWGPHDWSRGAPHNSWAPIIMSIGIGIFLYTLASVYSWGEMVDSSSIPLIFLGLTISFFGMIIWWRQDASFDGIYEPRATGTPFQNIQIRKVAMWMFLMSEMMVFTSLFSTYMRYRLGLTPCVEIYESGSWIVNSQTIDSGEAVNCFLPASELIASSWFHIAPGAINTFALIISSFTIVQALRWAKKPVGSVDEEVRRKRVYRYLGSTWILAIIFLTLKMVEWFVGFYIPEIGFLGLHEHNIVSLVNEGYTIHADHYHPHHGWEDTHLAELAAANPSEFEEYFANIASIEGGYVTTDAVMMADIRVSTSTFFVTTGTHGAHVFIGIIGLTYMTWKAWTGGYTPQNAVSIEYFGLYWHFVDLIWVLVFPFFYLY
tara:strand:+ start:26153 stop:27319 length:1167 start_codon:yes stop_codon:yes gene_type:complete